MQLDYNTIATTALWVLIGLVVVAVVLAIVIKKIVGKIITLVLAAVLVFFGWQQRAKIMDFKDSVTNTASKAYCDAQPSFFGIDVTFPGC